jgi:hypothetical protein
MHLFTQELIDGAYPIEVEVSLIENVLFFFGQSRIFTLAEGLLSEAHIAGEAFPSEQCLPDRCFGFSELVAHEDLELVRDGKLSTRRRTVKAIPLISIIVMRSLGLDSKLGSPHTFAISCLCFIIRKQTWVVLWDEKKSRLPRSRGLSDGLWQL